jgi:cytochrome P450
MLRAAQQLALDIMLQGFFGVTEPARMKTLGDAIFAWMSAYKHYLMLFKDLRRDFGGWGPWARFQRLARHFDDLVYAEIARRRAEQRYGEDILSLLLQARYEDGTTVGDQEIRDHLATLLNAGHETTAFVLTWAFYWLDRYPEARRRLQADLGALGPDPDPEAVAGLPFLEAVCKETLRLHAPIPILGRLLKRPFTLKGYTLPAGTTIAPSPYLVHHREDLYPDPECFKPERFLSRTYSSFEFLPFGGGTRRCPGSSFAIYAIKQALAMIVPRYVLGRTERRPVRPGMRGIIVGPTSDVEMVLQSLRSAA